MKFSILTTFVLLFSVLGFSQTVKINGIVKNSKDSIINFYKNERNILTREKDGIRHKAIIEPNGRFEITLPEKANGEWVLELGSFKRLLYLSTNKKLNIIIDKEVKTNNGVNGIIATGENVNDFNLLDHLVDKVNQKYDVAYFNRLSKALVKEALELRIGRAEYIISIIDEYNKKNHLSNEYYKWLITKFSYEPYERTCVESIINIIHPDKNLLELLTEKGIDSDYAAINSTEYNDLVEYYVHFQFKGILSLDSLFDFASKNLSGLTKEMYFTRQLFAYTKIEGNSYEELFRKYAKMIKNKAFISLLQQSRENYLNSLNENKIAKVETEKYPLIAEIFNKYNGKIVYLDFWASWCGPCKVEMPNAAKLKDKLRGKDIVFLYLGYGDEKDKWLKARNELKIDGEHYLLTPKMQTEVNDLFKITGIPHYAIIGKDGSIMDLNASRPSQVYYQLIKLEGK